MRKCIPINSSKIIALNAQDFEVTETLKSVPAKTGELDLLSQSRKKEVKTYLVIFVSLLFAIFKVFKLIKFLNAPSSM